jgi:ABC-type lipoprotein export system ATPase subunit
VRVAGQDLSTLSSGARKRLRRSFGLFTRTALPSEDEALLQAITTPAILCGHSIRDAMMLAADALTVCGLFPLADNRIRDLSEGERQLALLAQSLVNKPAVILADEPTAYLDEEHADAALRILAQYASEGGTVLAVSHNPLSDTFVTAIDMEKLHHV